MNSTNPIKIANVFSLIFRKDKAIQTPRIEQRNKGRNPLIATYKRHLRNLRLDHRIQFCLYSNINSILCFFNLYLIPSWLSKMIADPPVDVEIGSKSVEFEYKPLLPPEEPYISLDEISLLHSESHIDLMNVEKSMGLSPDEAAKRLNLYGRNALTPPPRMPEWKRFLLQFKNVFLILLRNLLSSIVDCLHHQQGYN